MALLKKSDFDKNAPHCSFSQETLTLSRIPAPVILFKAWSIANRQKAIIIVGLDNIGDAEMTSGFVE